MSLVTYGGPETDQSDEKVSPAPPRPLPSILKKPTFQQPRHSFSLNEPREFLIDWRQESESIISLRENCS